MADYKEIKRLFDIPGFQLRHYPQRRMLGGKTLGKLVTYSTQEVIDLANQLSLGLLQIGVGKGDKIAIISYNNRPEWNILDYGLQQVGAIGVPVYPTISSSEYEFIFNDAGVKYCFVGYGDLFDKVNNIRAKVPTLREIFTFEEDDKRAPHWSTLFTKGDYAAVKAVSDTIQPSDLATIIYTSGTTGNPKGVMLTHDNIISNIRAIWNLFPISTGELALSFLPLCHIFERTASYVYSSKGISIQYAESTDKLGENLQEFGRRFLRACRGYSKKYMKRFTTKGWPSQV